MFGIRTSVFGQNVAAGFIPACQGRPYLEITQGGRCPALNVEIIYQR
ncbi:hypothetical protein D1AOALGA4SA_13173 [Olavius algarvensis Delta 1 endosymbiont]|nr:hypothetical protein D1AOALGA4SA_13173 [Olavius algarvensis Delta 1 endosymbiont]